MILWYYDIILSNKPPSNHSNRSINTNNTTGNKFHQPRRPHTSTQNHTPNNNTTCTKQTRNTPSKTPTMTRGSHSPSQLILMVSPPVSAEQWSLNVILTRLSYWTVSNVTASLKNSPYLSPSSTLCPGQIISSCLLAFTMHPSWLTGFCRVRKKPAKGNKTSDSPIALSRARSISR